MQFDLTHPLFQAALPVLKHIESHGYEAYFVGGCVRDTVLNLPIHDIDIASSATPDEIEAIFPFTFEVGKKHGTIIVLHENVPYEITTFRTEGTYSDYRRPDEVIFVRNLEEDTLRRDFTVNALAFDRNGTLYDYHAGMQDIDAELIRAVGNAQDRFNEDALRMLRAIRFASQLNFKIEETTFKALQTLAPLIKNVSIERIRIELSKYFQGNYFQKHYLLLVESKIVNFLPGIKEMDFNNALSKMALFLAPLIEQQIVRDERLCWSLLLYFSGIRSKTEIRKNLRTWKHSNQFILEVISMTTLLETYNSNQLSLWRIYQHDREMIAIIDQMLSLNGHPQAGKGMDLYEALPIKHRSELAINGSILMQTLEMTKGTPLIGQVINYLEQQVVMEQLPNVQSTLLEQAVSRINEDGKIFNASNNKI